MYSCHFNVAITVAYFAVKRTVLTETLTEKHLFAKYQCHSYYTEDTTAGINDHFLGTVKFSGIYGHYKHHETSDPQPHLKNMLHS